MSLAIIPQNSTFMADMKDFKVVKITQIGIYKLLIHR